MHLRTTALILLAATACTPFRPRGQAIIEADLAQQSVAMESERGFAVAKLYESQFQSCNLVRVDQPLALHRHRHSEETVYVIQGRGTLHLGDRDQAVQAGDFVVIPRNTPHGYTPHGSDTSVVLSIFAPPLREGDRIFEDDPLEN